MSMRTPRPYDIYDNGMESKDTPAVPAPITQIKDNLNGLIISIAQTIKKLGGGKTRDDIIAALIRLRSFTPQSSMNYIVNSHEKLKAENSIIQ